MAKKTIAVSKRTTTKDPVGQDMKKEIRDFFRENGLESSAIYRTVQREFGKESPSNLLPKESKDRTVRVFIDFNGSPASRENIRQIVAIPYQVGDTLPMFYSTLSKSWKVDLTALPKKFLFSNIEELKDQYFKRFVR